MKKNLLLKAKISLLVAFFIFACSFIVKAQTTTIPFTDFTVTAECAAVEDFDGGISGQVVFCVGDYMEYDFEATGVALYGVVHINDAVPPTGQEAEGRADIYIDGVIASPPDGVVFWTTGAEQLLDVFLWKSAELNAGEIHNIKIVTRGDWITVTKLVIGTFTSISQTAAIENSFVYPNPGKSDNLRIRLNSAQNNSLTNIRISDITGKELYSRNVSGTDIHLKNLNLPKGINLVTISNSNSTQILKYIVK